MQLRTTVSKTEKALKAESLQAIERPQTSLKTITTEIELLKGKVEVKKITKEESHEEIEKWVSAIDEELSKADIKLKRLQEWQEAVSSEKSN